MMTAFLFAAGALMLASMGFVLWPLWRGKQPAGSRREANVAVYEQHAAEIQHELTAGQITADTAVTRRNELDAQLLFDVDETSRLTGFTARRPWLASAVVVVGFAVLAIGLYSVSGDMRSLMPRQTPDISALVAQMKTRLANAPEDLRTRALLGQVQMAQHRYAAAAQTFAQLNARQDTPDTVFLVAEARARVRGNGGQVNERAQDLYKRVLALAPDNIEALWFAGLAALADGRPEVAARRWQHLLELDIPDQFRTTVERRLAEVQGEVPNLILGN